MLGFTALPWPKAHHFSHESGGDHTALSWKVNGKYWLTSRSELRGAGPECRGWSCSRPLPLGSGNHKEVMKPVTMVLPRGAAELMAMAVVSRTPTSCSVER